MNTRESVIRGQLLFKTGDLYSDRIVQETERILRANDYLYDATIVPVAYDGKHVDLEVRTRDTWTLNPGINFSRTGGKNEYAVQIQEKNLLGRGQRLELEWANRRRPRVADPSVLRSALPDRASRVSPSPTATPTTARPKYFSLDRPFYALDTRWSAGTTLSDSDFNVDRWELGKRGRQVRDARAVLRGQRGLVGRAAGRLGATLDLRRHVPAERLRASAGRAARRTAAGGSQVRLSLGRVRPGRRTRSRSAINQDQIQPHRGRAGRLQRLGEARLCDRVAWLGDGRGARLGVRAATAGT